MRVGVEGPEGRQGAGPVAGDRPRGRQAGPPRLPEPGAGGRPVAAVVVGPEGGISEAETTALRDAGAVAVRLGPHILRTASAGPLALAVLAQRAGLWG